MPCDRRDGKASSAGLSEGLDGAGGIRADGRGRGPHVVVPRPASAPARRIGGRSTAPCWTPAAAPADCWRACGRSVRTCGRSAWSGPQPACRRAAAKSGAPVVRGSVNALPFADASFDAAIAADLLCHARGRSGAGAGRTAARAAPGRQADRQHAGLRAGCCRRTTGRCTTSAAAPRASSRRCCATAGFVRVRARLLEQPAAAADGGAAQAAGPQRDRLGRRPVSAMARCACFMP